MARLSIPVIVLTMFYAPVVNAMFTLDISGTVVVGADMVPVRLSYPDGRIISVLRKGEAVGVDWAEGFGDGFWLHVRIKVGDKDLTGYIPASLTNFDEAAQSGSLKGLTPIPSELSQPTPSEWKR